MRAAWNPRWFGWFLSMMGTGMIVAAAFTTWWLAVLWFAFAIGGAVGQWEQEHHG